MADLKLIALDAEDLAILAAHLQDAVLRVGDMAYLKPERRFAAVANRFDWDEAARPRGRSSSFVRRRTGVRFEHVTGVKIAGVDLAKKDDVLSLLTLTFEPGDDPPQGAIILTFAGGSAMRLDVDFVEAALTDLGAAWATRSKPEHSENSSSS